MTADAFVARIQEFPGLSPQVQTDLLAHYLLSEGGVAEVAVGRLASLREALHLAPQPRLAQYLSESTKRRSGRTIRYVKTKAGYVLERGYSNALAATYLGRPSAINVASSLRGTLGAIGDKTVRAYLEEALACFENNLLRSSIVMTWCVAFSLVRSWLFRNHLVALNATMGAWRKPHKITTLDDFQDLAESTILDAAKTSGALTKEQHKTLRALLDLRNSYAHPTAKPIKAATAESFIETVLDEIVPTFG